MTTQKLTKEQREKIIEARYIIYNDFAWVCTKEGLEYWRKVYEALDRIAYSNIKKCPHCGEEIEE